MTEEEWDAVINVHLKGHFATSRFAGRVLAPAEQGHRRPVNGDDREHRVGVGPVRQRRARSNYAAAKAGIASMTIVMARELERIGVRVNAIAPVAPHPAHRGPSPATSWTRRKASSTASHPRTSPPSSAGSPPISPTASPARWSRCRAASAARCRAGGRSRRSTSDEAVDDRVDRRRSRTSCSRARTPACRRSCSPLD